MQLDQQLLDQITEAAKASPRLRMNYNLHEVLESKAQRLFNGLEPGTELPIHRHTHSAETYIVVRGAIKVFFYDDQKRVTQEMCLSAGTGAFGAHIPLGTWHTLEVLESGTVIFEVKDGPYTPLTEGDVLG